MYTDRIELTFDAGHSSFIIKANANPHMVTHSRLKSWLVHAKLIKWVL